MHYGVDVSSNNEHPIAWVSLYRYLYGLGGEQPFAIVKISQGTTYVNEDAHDDIAAAKLAGFVVGGYLMDQGNADPGQEEAVFRAHSEGVPQFDDDELPEGLSTTAYIAHLQSLVAVADVPQYLNQSEEDEGFPAGAGIWEANYNGKPGVTHRAGVLIHQYTSSATVPGASGEFDLNCWTGSEAQFAQFFGVAPSPSPTPEGENDVISGVKEFKPGQLDVFQVSGGVLWHKWAIDGKWENESIPLPSGFGPVVGEPQVEVLGGACWVSVEDESGKGCLFMQTATSGTWANQPLP